MLGYSCRTGTVGTPIGASKVVSSHEDEGNCSSSDGTDVSSGGAGGGDSGDTEAAGQRGLPEKARHPGLERPRDQDDRAL